MIDSCTSLAIATHSNPGVYALLLGSGVSRAANIPTGWEVVEDLIGKIAAASGEECGSDREAWYTERFGAEPTYSGVLKAVGKSTAERSGILKAYFEPTEEEQENGDKQPTKAHKAIARLVQRGYIRVILTTNFDRLMERALEAEGVSPTVISRPSDIEAASPLQHAKCTLIKLHGDYLDLTTKNTTVELSTYDRRLKKHLDRILDEYGLIICGWSADWDKALRDALYRCKSRRYTTWWTAHGTLTESAQQLTTFCQAEVIPIQTADEFFDNLDERVSALEQFDRVHPVSTKIAVALTKKYVAEDKYRIQLRDLLMKEIEKIVTEVCSDRYPTAGTFLTDLLVQRILAFDAASETACCILKEACFWDNEGRNADTYCRSIIRLANAAKSGKGNPCAVSLRMHCARLLLYAAGIASIASKNLSLTYRLFSGSALSDSPENVDLTLAFAREVDLWTPVFQSLPGMGKRPLPISDHYFAVLKPVFSDLLPDTVEYRNAFDTFEVIQSFYSADIVEQVVPGAYVFRTNKFSPFSRLVADVKEKKEQSDFLLAGFCRGEMGRFEKAHMLVHSDKWCTLRTERLGSK